MKVEKVVKSRDDVSAAKSWCMEELKHRLWREVWSDMIELNDARIDVEERADGQILVRVEL